MEQEIKIYGVVGLDEYWKMKRDAVSGVQEWDKNIPKTLFADHSALSAYAARIAQSERAIPAS